MQENKNPEATEPVKKHFFKFHERIQSKYEKMQKKMAKAKSVDSLSYLSEDYDYTNPKHCSTIDLRELEDTHSDIRSLSQSSVVEEVALSHVSLHEMNRSSSVSRLVDDYIVVERCKQQNEKEFFGENDPGISLESINEVGAESDDSECTTPPTPNTKISIRNRISIAIEKRKEKKREKDMIKKRKGEGRERVEKYILSNSNKQDVSRFYKRVKEATLTIALIEATELETDISEDKPRLLFCRFRLGGEKFKSKIVKSTNATVKWQELFNLNVYEEQMLELSLWDKDSFIGRSIIDLTDLEKEKTHRLRINLECDVGKTELFILLTVSGTFLVNTVVDYSEYEAAKRRISNVRNKYAWYHVKNETGDIGLLSVIVYGAKGLVTNENYCILQLGNERLQTYTESKTNEPNWMKIFTFPVLDITSILEITVHDEKKAEDVGKISIPLLHIKNGEKKWYALKDVTQRERAKGQNPRILLEMRVTWNILRASMRVINPKEENYLELEEKLQRYIFARNLSRARAVVNWIIDAFRIFKTLFEWESRKLNVIAITIWLILCWYFKIWMVPLLLLIPFHWYRPQKYVWINWQKYVNTDLALEIYNDPKEEKEEKTTWRQKLNSLSDMVQTVQNFIGQFASYGESVKNLFNFTVPYLSWLAIILISLIALVVYFIPLNYILMIWGIHKFTRKTLRPNRIPNNEIIDLLSRVPDDETLLNIQELPLEDVEKDVIN